MRGFHGDVMLSIKRGSVSPLMYAVYARLSKTLSAPETPPLACRPGCSHCCHAAVVQATAPEILYLVKGLAARRRGELGCPQPLNDGADDPQSSLAARPCAALRDDLCSVYGGRPLNCRTAVSTDAAACFRAFRQLAGGDIPTSIPYLLAKSGYYLALCGALRRAGLPYCSYDLNSGIRAALACPKAEQRWLSGDDLFEGRASSEPQDPFLIGANAEIYAAAFPSPLLVP